MASSNKPTIYKRVAQDWITCVQRSSKEIADKLLNSNRLPDKNILNDLCYKFGRKNVTTIKVCKAVCRYIESFSQHIVDVYPSRKAVVLKQIDGKEEKIKIQFVVLTEHLNKDGRKELEILIRKEYDTLPVRDCNQLSSEETHLQKWRNNELKDEALNEVKACLRQHADTLLNTHKYLSVVSGCAFKSIGFGTNHRIEETPCIVLNVPYKGYIPIDEDPFNEIYSEVQTDVREDFFVLFGSTAKERLDNLMTGCLISGEPDENDHCAKGTLGGFFVHPDYGPCGISCSHAVLSPSELNSISKDGEIDWKCPSSLLGNDKEAFTGNVYQPEKTKVNEDDKTNHNKIGRIVQVRYRRGKGKSKDLDAYGMDIAIFQLNDRLPKWSGFPDIKVSEGSEECEKIPVQFTKGAVAGHTRLEEKIFSKYGAITGYTTGELSNKCSVAVKKPLRWIKKEKYKKNRTEFDYILQNQISLQGGNTDCHDIIPFDRPDESTEYFAYKGDSGALVYRDTFDGDLLCVGMVVGGRKSQKTCMVTPILPVLREIGITNFKNFDIDQMENNVKTLSARMDNISETLERVVTDVQSIKESLGGLAESVIKQEKSKLLSKESRDETVHVDEDVKSSSKEMVDKLLDSNQTFDMKELNELCHTYGRQSETTLKVCYKVCRDIEKFSQQIVDVYPSRKADVLKTIDGKEEKFEIKFVVVTKQMSKEGRHELETRINKCYDTLPVRDCNQLSCEETAVITMNYEHNYELNCEDLNTIKSCLRQNAGTLLNKHKYLTIVSGCPYKSIGYGTDDHRIEEIPCIVLNVPYKGYIPIDEEPFDESYSGVKTDVREDVFVLFGGTAADRHEHLMAGCRISGEPDEHNHCGKGTLGAFLVHPEYGLCGMSCSHTVLTPSELKSMSQDGEINWDRPSSLLVNSEEKSEKYVYQPMKNDDNGSTDGNKIGRLVKVRYRKGIENSQDLDAYGMDVAIFQLSDRLPNSSKFPNVKVSESAEGNLEIPVQFGKGDVEGFTWLDKNKYSKYGATTGYTTTNLSINSTVSVKTTTTSWRYTDKTKDAQFEFILHNQVCFGKDKKDDKDITPFDIKSDENKNKWFAYLGDSGALVYRINTDDNLVCVGMVVGGRKSQKTCIVTPILPILKEMRITHFKNFATDEMEKNVKTLVDDVKAMGIKLDKALESISQQTENNQKRDTKLDEILDFISKQKENNQV